MRAWLRPDGRKGIRNTVAVAYLVECAHHVAPRDRSPVRGRGRACHRLPGLLSATTTRDEMMERLCTHPNVGARAAGLAGLRELRPLGPASRRSRRPAGRCKTLVIQAAGGTRAHVEAGREWVERDARADWPRTPTVPMALSRARRRHDLRRLGRDLAASPPTPPWAAPSTCSSSDGAACIFEETGELIGCEHIMAARAVTPGARRRDRGQRRQGGALLQATWATSSFAAGQCRGRAHDHRGEIAGRLRQVRRLADLGPDQARRHAAARRALSARRRARRRAALRLPQHQRQCRDRRADRLRQPRRSCSHRARLGGRLGDLAGDQGLRQSRHLPADGRRHGRRCRPHPRRPRRRSTRSAARSATSVERVGVGRARPSPRSSATRSSS